MCVGSGRFASKRSDASIVVAAAEASPGERAVASSRAISSWPRCSGGSVASVDALENAETRLFAAAARRYLEKLVKGDEGAALVRRAEDAMRSQSVRNVAAMSRCLAPGFTHLD